MASWPWHDERLRAMYAGGRADTTARRFARLWAAVFRVVPDPAGPAARASKRRTRAGARRSAPSRKRHWWRWILGGTVGAVAVVFLAAGIFIKLQPAAPALVLPTAHGSTPVGPLDGTWAAGSGSVAGFRVRETALGFSNDVVGRTNAVTGTIVIAGNRVTSATFRVSLTNIKVSGKTQPQFARSLGTRDHPAATFTLAQPVTLGPAFSSGTVITVTATGYLAMNGISRLVTFTISGRRSGSAMQAAGSIPVTFSEWGIATPKGYGLLGSLANHGTAEFLLILHRETPAHAG